MRNGGRHCGQFHLTARSLREPMMNAHANLAAAMGGVARPRKSRWPARLDFAQSASGLILGLFMWGHMFFVSSILLGNDAMWTITKMFEGYFFFGRPTPVIVSGVVAVVFILFIAHAGLAVRKFPINYAQYRVYRDHMGMMHHEDTTLWWWQVVTGFAMFFLASVHLYQMLMHPGLIGPFESADRVWSGRWWPLYLVLLFCRRAARRHRPVPALRSSGAGSPARMPTPRAGT